jgi:hypothetical protein
MMPKMVLFQPKPNSSLHPKIVNRMMDRIVADITEDEPGKHRRGERVRCPLLVSDIKKTMCGIS